MMMMAAKATQHGPLIRSSHLIRFLVFLIFVIFVCPMALKQQPHEMGKKHETDNLCGGIYDTPSNPENDAKVEMLACFAVEEHNNIQNKVLEFSRVVKAREQVVAGMLHHLTVEAIDGGMKKLYEAKILVQPWLNVQKLTEFTHAGDSPCITPSDLGADRDGHVRGWKVVPVDDPEVLNAAHHAVKSIQQRSNSLLPYKLHEISHAKAEVVDDTANFNLALKVKRGNNEEKFNVEVHKNNEGNFILNEIGGN